MKELITKVQKWSIDKELHEADPIKQTVKLVEELGELASGLLKDKNRMIIYDKLKKYNSKVYEGFIEWAEDDGMQIIFGEGYILWG